MYILHIIIFILFLSLYHFIQYIERIILWNFFIAILQENKLMIKKNKKSIEYLNYIRLLSSV